MNRNEKRIEFIANFQFDNGRVPGNCEIPENLKEDYSDEE